MRASLKEKSDRGVHISFRVGDRDFIRSSRVEIPQDSVLEPVVIGIYKNRQMSRAFCLREIFQKNEQLVRCACSYPYVYKVWGQSKLAYF